MKKFLCGLIKRLCSTSRTRKKLGLTVGHIKPISEGGPWSKDYLDNLREGNFKKCQRTERLLAYDDPAIIGFWAP